MFELSFSVKLKYKDQPAIWIKLNVKSYFNNTSEGDGRKEIYINTERGKKCEIKIKMTRKTRKCKRQNE